ncbi:MAG: hypothetical protein H7255_05790 [Ramlibacter sp.]|nr:hypothetical protein [Ramlibacter sp.]
MVNPKGFVDTLEPVRQRAQWQFERSLATLTVLRARLAATRSELHALEAHASEQSTHAVSAWRTRVDPTSQTRALCFLATVHSGQVRARLQIAELEEQATAARDECVKRQARLEALQLHRIAALNIFVQDQRRKETAQADDDWLMRGQACNRDSQHE